MPERRIAPLAPAAQSLARAAAVALLAALTAVPSAAADEDTGSSTRLSTRFYAGFAIARYRDERPRMDDSHDHRLLTRGFQADAGVFVSRRLAIGIELLTLPRVESVWSDRDVSRSWTGEEERAAAGIVRYALYTRGPASLEVLGGVGALRGRERREVTIARWSGADVTSTWRHRYALVSTAGVELAIRPNRHVCVAPTVRVSWLDVDTDPARGSHTALLERSSLRWTFGLVLRAQR